MTEHKADSKPARYRWAQFRKGSQFFECYCEEKEAIAAINFVRFLS